MAHLECLIRDSISSDFGVDILGMTHCPYLDCAFL